MHDQQDQFLKGKYAHGFDPVNIVDVRITQRLITFIQAAYATPQSPTSSVPVTFIGGQTFGNLNVVAVGWSDSTSTINSVTDSAGNVYTLAVGPTRGTAMSQAIYYSPNIAFALAGKNTVTVQFSGAVPFPDVRILEYNGLATSSPVDITAAASGAGTTADSGSATTTNANDLIFGAALVSTTSGVGAGFTSRVVTAPDGDIAEDKVVSAVGSYNATATLSSGNWVMQMVAFKAPAS